MQCGKTVGIDIVWKTGDVGAVRGDCGCRYSVEDWRCRCSAAGLEWQIECGRLEVDVYCGKTGCRYSVEDYKWRCSVAED